MPCRTCSENSSAHFTLCGLSKILFRKQEDVIQKSEACILGCSAPDVIVTNFRFKEDDAVTRSTAPTLRV